MFKKTTSLPSCQERAKTCSVTVSACISISSVKDFSNRLAHSLQWERYSRLRNSQRSQNLNPLEQKVLSFKTLRQNKFQETLDRSTCMMKQKTMSLCTHHTIHWLQQCSLTSIKIKSIILTSTHTYTHTSHTWYRTNTHISQTLTCTQDVMCSHIGTHIGQNLQYTFF